MCDILSIEGKRDGWTHATSVIIVIREKRMKRMKSYLPCEGHKIKHSLSSLFASL